MVTIRYYSDPTRFDFEEFEYDKLSKYIIDNFNTRDEILDLRFFHDEILGEEVDQSDLSFLDIEEGLIAVTHNSKLPRTPDTWIYIAIALASALVTVLLTPDIVSPNRSQESATNALGASNNEPRINQRIDDIFGSLTKHVPPLWQVPYRIGVNNEETEVLLVCLGRGKYLTDVERVYDGDTKVVNIPNAKWSKYGPGTHPGKGLPEQQIGEDVDEKIGIYRQSNDLNVTELSPPNDLDNNAVGWKLTGDGSNGIIKVTESAEDFDLNNHYVVGDEITLRDINYFERLGNVRLYRREGVYPIVKDFGTYLEPVDVSEGGTLLYTVTSVDTLEMTVEIPTSATQEVKDAWLAMNGYEVVQRAFKSTNPPPFEFVSTDDGLGGVDWYTDATYTTEIVGDSLFYSSSIGVPFDGSVGPFKVADNAEEIILNFVSPSGFYKLSNNNETQISAVINVRVDELDVNDNPTGEFEIFPVEYKSNENNIRRSVFVTERIVLPYERNQVLAVRTTNRDKGSGVSNVDIVEWRDLFTFESVGDQDFGDVTLAHIVIPSNSTSRLTKERRQNLDLTRLITEYKGNGVFGPAESFATDDFDQILIHTALDPRIGRLQLSDINADGFLLLKQQIKDYFGSDEMVRFGYDFDDSEVTYQDIFMIICQVVMCHPYVQNGVYDAFFEKKQEVSGMQITCRNKIEGSEVREDIFERNYDGVEVTYRDEKTSISETVYIPEDRSSVNPERREINGCITSRQATIIAKRMYNKQIHSRKKISFDVDEFGRNIIPGKRIDSPDSTRFTKREGTTGGYRVYDGEVVEVNGLFVELSEPVDFTAGEDHYIVFTKENGDNSDAILCTRHDDFTVELSALPEEAVYDGYGRDRTKYIFMSEQLSGSIALIPQTIEFSMDDEGNETNTIGSINYSDQYYKDDLEIVA